MTNDDGRPGAADLETLRERGREALKSGVKAFKSFELHDRIVLAGSAIFFVLGFFDWFSISAPMGVGKLPFGMPTIGVDCYQLWHGKIAFLSSLAATLFIALPDLRKQLLGQRTPLANAIILLGLTAATLIFGPLFFAMNIRVQGQQALDLAKVSVGRTFWFYLAFLAALAALGAAAAKWRELSKG